MGIDQETSMRLLLTHRTMLIGYIASIVRDPHMTEDVFQEVAILVHKKHGQITGEREFPAWARGTARLVALGALRGRKNAPKPLDEKVMDSLEEQWDALDREGKPAEAIDALRECIGELTPRSRRMVDLRYGDGLSGENLADRLGMRLNAVYVALSRIHKALASCVKLRLAKGDMGRV